MQIAPDITAAPCSACGLSRLRHGSRLTLAAHLALAMCLVLAVCVASAHEAYASEIVGQLEVECASGNAIWDEAHVVELAVPAVKGVAMTCAPDSILVGVSCGMNEMCGLDPCLCGAADSFGACACNGLEERVPDVAMTSTNPLAAWPVRVGSSWRIISLLPGKADIRVSGTLGHYDAFQATYHVESAVRSPVDAAVALVATVVVIAVIALAVRGRLRARKRPEAEGGPHG